MSTNADKSRPKPAMHRDLEGRLHPPIGTLGEQLQRAIEPKPRALDWHHQQRLWATFQDNSHEFVRIFAPYLRGGEG